MTSDPGWNHNNHYHSLLLEAMPNACKRALDIGCGLGEFSRLLASRAQTVVGIDRSAEMIQEARRRSAGVANLVFVEADFLEYPIETGDFDFISLIAVLHHLPFEEAINKIKNGLGAGGVLAVLGLSRDNSPASLLATAVSIPVHWFYTLTRPKPRPVESQIRLTDPSMTLREIRRAAARLLPGAVLRRHLLWRYSLIWQNAPSASGGE